MTDTSKDAVYRLVLAMIRSGNTTAANMLTALAVERDELAFATDSIEASHGLTDNGNLWRFWAKKAREIAAKNTNLSAQLSAANARADQAWDAALVEAAKEAHAFAAENQWHPSSVTKLVTRILALRDKPAPAVTVQEAIREVWGCCEELEDEALAKLSVVKTEHEKGFWTGQKMTAKRIRRATQMPTAGGGNE